MMQAVLYTVSDGQADAQNDATGSGRAIGGLASLVRRIIRTAAREKANKESRGVPKERLGAGKSERRPDRRWCERSWIKGEARDAASEGVMMLFS